jgi:DNA mismatch repair protein MutS2
LLDGDLEGVVVEVRDRRAVVDASGIRMRVPLTDLVPLDSAEGRAVEPRGSASWSAPSGPISTEVDLRGLRVDEVGDPLLRSIDEAILSDLTELRIIHGKGTGAVRARVKELLEGDGRVSDFRLGRPGEGGGGVTVASFR